MNEPAYDDKFFAEHQRESRDSAFEVVPVVLKFLQPKSVVDVGCGIGAWLSVFQANEIADTLGIDGDYVDRRRLMIEPERFLVHDLSQPLKLDRRFDLAVNLEVAEHLPAECADDFVASLTRLAPVVLFSAAIPKQGGTNHVNEQWPEYWRARFRKLGYVVVDCLRRELWHNAKIARFYRQNLLFFVDRASIDNYPRLAEVFAREGEQPPLSMVHPEHYQALLDGMRDKLAELRRHIARSTLRLRDISLIAFPMWTLTREEVLGQLRTLVRALNEHPQRAKMTLVIDQGIQHEAANALINQVARELLAPAGSPLNDVPLFSFVGGILVPEEWATIVDCLQGRVQLNHEDDKRFGESGASSLPSISLASLQSKQPIVQ